MHVGHRRFSLLNQNIFLIPLDSKRLADGCAKASFPSSPRRFPMWEPWDGTDSRGLELPLREGGRSRQRRCKAQQRQKNQYNSPDPKWGFLSGGVFLQIVSSKRTSVTKITYLLSQRTLLPAAVPCPRKEPKFFSSLGKKIKLFSQALARGSWTGLKTTQKTSEAILQVQPGSLTNLPKQHFPHFNNIQLISVLKITSSVYVD